MPFHEFDWRYTYYVAPLPWRLESVWQAWMACHGRWSLDATDRRNMNEACRAGIVFG